jgi:hypothetical protein
MAPLPEIDGVTRVAFEWGPLPAVNVMHFHQADAVHTILWNALKANVKQNMWMSVANTQSVQRVRFTTLDGSSPTIVETPPGGGAWTGPAGGDPIPASASVVSLKTVFRGRSNRGRIFIGPNGETAQAAGIITPTTVSGMITAWTQFQIDMTGAGVQHVVASYKAGTALTVVQYNIRTQAGTVRRRQDALV